MAKYTVYGSGSIIQGTNTRNVGLSLPPFPGNIIQDIGNSIVDLDSPKKGIAKNKINSMFGVTFRSLKRLSTRHGLIACYVISMPLHRNNEHRNAN